MTNRRGRSMLSPEEQLNYYGWSIDSNNCWNWLGPVNAYGYGTFKASKQRFMAHRVASHAPDGLLACHTCDNRLCVNPEHIFFGTHKDNTADMIRKGRAGWQRGSM